MNKDLGAAQTGFHDWYWQRISAVVLLLSIPALMLLLLLTYNGNIAFSQLYTWLTLPISKSISTLFLFALLTHIWTGLKVIIEDYIHTTGQRIVVLNILFISLLGFAAYMTYHIWAELVYTFGCIPCGA
ncbi:succinate dehydrogenase, hydrophobic membrane anchor protein [Ghiorsea bivora]|uniref:succinate dehydrogenase, hydrophobic membrane anchor protein n=1 Tax=Ghiorsea bivora TaxID=1485545 RepID=UPI00068EAF3D|nr:succinate dehydrogenase, hydrophobic membrane anchor protein [Ghiorsea bivora]